MVTLQKDAAATAATTPTAAERRPATAELAVPKGLPTVMVKYSPGSSRLG